jgi:phospholipid-translocating ATPase
VALVKFVEEIGYKIVKRDQSTLVIEVDNQRQEYKILNNFPFSSESKRMGIIVR